MIIREATMSDTTRIGQLLAQMDYPQAVRFIEKNLQKIIGKPDYRTLVCEINGEVISLMTIHFWQQIGFEKETCTISFFVVDENIRSKGIGKAMEEYCTKLARERDCFEIEVFSNLKRKDAHRFYERQGYEQIEKLFFKLLDVE